MARGTVKWFSEEKDYGFVSPDEGGEDLFVHYTGIEGEGFRSLEEGERISYESIRGRKGERAESVRKIRRSRRQAYRRPSYSPREHYRLVRHYRRAKGGCGIK